MAAQGGWDQDLTIQSLESQGPLPPPPPERPMTPGPSEGLNFPVDSPLMKEVEEQHAILEAAMGETESDKQSDAKDLEERVRRLEASLSAFRQVGGNMAE